MNYKIELTAADIEYLGNLLDERPFKEVFDLVRRIQPQIEAQNAAEKARSAAAWDQAVAAAAQASMQPSIAGAGEAGAASKTKPPRGKKGKG